MMFLKNETFVSHRYASLQSSGQLVHKGLSTILENKFLGKVYTEQSS